MNISITSNSFEITNNFKKTISVNVDGVKNIDTKTNNSKEIKCQIVLGVLTYFDQKYLLISKSTKEVGDILDAKIYQLLDVEILPFGNNSVDSTFRNYVDRLFFNSYFYFSDGGKYDLSKTLQKQNEPDSQESFVWNSTMLLDEKITSSFFTKVIQGFVSIEKIDEKIKFAVVSRRSKFRAGTRYNRRGVDDEGNAANFVQTEQILETEKNSNSFVILRFYFFF
jgi:hypothetical protein